MLRRACTTPVFAALVLGCGARTGLGLAEAGVEADAGKTDGGVEAAPPFDAAHPIDAEPPDAPLGECGAPDPRVSLSMSAPVQFGGPIASSGCTFAGTWVENRGRHFDVKAAIVRVQAGVWTATRPVTIARASINAGSTAIAWDGSEYVVAWTDRAVFMTRLSEEGVVLGPASRLFKVTQDGAITAMTVGSDGQVRMGLLNDPVERLHYRTYFARMTTAGEVTLQPTRLVPPSGNDIMMSFLFEGGSSNQLLWLGGDPVDEVVHLETFDDSGDVLHDVTLGSGGAIDNIGGLASVGSSEYYGELVGSRAPRSVVREVGTNATIDVAGQEPPIFATIPGGPLGALAPAYPVQPTDLVLSVITGSVVTSVKRIPANGSEDGPLEYAVAGGTGSFGVVWTDNVAVHFTVVTP